MRYVLIDEELLREEYNKLTREELIIKLLDLKEEYIDMCLENMNEYN